MTERQRAAAQTRRKPAAKPPRRTQTYLTPQLLPVELGALISLIDAEAESGTGLLDPSLAACRTELARWM